MISGIILNYYFIKVVNLIVIPKLKMGLHLKNYNYNLSIS